MAKRSSRKKTTSSRSPKAASKPADAGSGEASESAPERPDDVAESLARLHVWQVQAVRDVLLVAAIIAIFWAGYALRAVTVPLLVALLLAYLFGFAARRRTPLPERRRCEKLNRLPLAHFVRVRLVY